MAPEGEEKSSIRFNTLSCRISVRLHHVLSPIDPNFLRNLLTLLKYIPSSPSPTPGESIEIISAAKIATRDNISIDYNPDKDVILAAGREIHGVVLAFEELINTIRKQLGGKTLKTWFFEVSLTGLGEGRKSPLDVFGSVENNLPKSKELKAIFGEEVSPFGIRIAPSAKPLDSANWFEYRIEPYIPQADAIYLAVSVYRHEQLENVKNFAFSFEEKSREVITTVEESGKQEKLDKSK